MARKKAKSLRQVLSKRLLNELNSKLQNQTHYDLEDLLTGNVKKEQRQECRDFMKRAEKAGFTKSMAKFLYEELAQSDHKHWDGRVGGS